MVVFTMMIQYYGVVFREEGENVKFVYIDIQVCVGFAGNQSHMKLNDQYGRRAVSYQRGGVCASARSGMDKDHGCNGRETFL